MKKIIIAIVVGILLVGANVFAADGDLVVNGKLGVGTTTPATQVYVVDAAGSGTRGVIVAEHYNGTGAALYQFRRSRGTEAAPTALQNGDNSGAIHSYAYDGTVYQNTGSIVFNINGTVAVSSVPTDILFYAGTAGGVNRPERMRITSAGRVGIGTVAPAAPLDVRPPQSPASGETPYGIIVLNTVNTGQTNNAPQNVIRTDYNGTTSQTFSFGLVTGVNKNSTGSLSQAIGVHSNVNNYNATGSIDTAIAFYAAPPVKTGTVGASFGFYSADPLSSNYFAGKFGIGIIPTHLIHLSGGAYSDGATWVNASSRDYKENISDLSAADANGALKGLNPVLYNYKTNKDQRHVGFIAEDVPEMVATKDRKGLSAMDIVAVLTKVVKEQKQTVEALSAEVAELKADLIKLRNGNLLSNK